MLRATPQYCIQVPEDKILEPFFKLHIAGQLVPVHLLVASNLLATMLWGITNSRNK